MERILWANFLFKNLQQKKVTQPQKIAWYIQYTHHDSVNNVIVIFLKCLNGLVSANVGLLNHQLDVLLLHTCLIDLGMCDGWRVYQ